MKSRNERKNRKAKSESINKLADEQDWSFLYDVAWAHTKGCRNPKRTDGHKKRPNYKEQSFDESCHQEESKLQKTRDADFVKKIQTHGALLFKTEEACKDGELPVPYSPVNAETIPEVNSTKVQSVPNIARHRSIWDVDPLFVRLPGVITAKDNSAPTQDTDNEFNDFYFQI